MIRQLTISGISGMLCLGCALALQASATSFSEIHETYKGAVEAKDWPLALSSSRAAVEEGLRSFDPAGENVANLRLNYARELLRDGQDGLAKEQLALCLKSKVATYGRKSPELVDVLFELGRSTVQTNSGQARKHFQRAIELAAEDGDELVEADITLQAGLNLAKAGESRSASRHLREARDFYLERYGSHDVRAGLAGLNLGQIEFNNNDNKRARETLTTALQAFQSSEPSARALKSAAHRLLVNILETMDLRAEATQHAVGYALSTAVNGFAQPTMLHRASGAVLGADTRGRDGTESAGGLGTAIIYFDIDDEGFVVNPRVESTSADDVGSTAIRSITSRRYSPKIENGEPAISRDHQMRYRIRR